MIRWLFNQKPNAKPLGWGDYINRLFVLIIAWILLYQLWIFLHICWWIKFNPSSTAFMRARLSVMQQAQPEAKLNYRWVDYAHISNHLKRAVVASEDAKFVNHDGFDWEGIEKAIDKNLKKGKLVAGGSTISQQLAKNLFLSSQRTPWRKGEEVIITLMLEQLMSKRRILEIYLNVVEWGKGVFGAEAAARHYFSVGASGLSRLQSAKLAAMLPNPRFYDVHRSTRYLNRRTAAVNARMQSAELP